jgi:predicted amidophosphoribosyltransferase
MASDAKNLFGCPFCGFRVSPMDESCPRCGNGFSEGTRFECPFCGDLVAPGTKECPSCHVNFGEFLTKSKKHVSEDSIDSLLMEIIRMESTQVRREEKKFSCPKCSWMLDGSETRCPKCGEDFREDAMFQCPICGSFVNANASKCPDCGTLLAGETQLADEQRVADDHEDFSSALSEILVSAGHTGPLPERVKVAPEPERPVAGGSSPEVVRPEPEPVEVPEPEPVKMPEPEPIKLSEPVPEPEKVEPPPAEPEPAPEQVVPAAAPKKAKQRKLKGKPSGSQSGN